MKPDIIGQVSGAAEVSGAQAVQPPAFDAELEAIARKDAYFARRRPLRTTLAEFVMPKIGDPSVMQGNSIISVMEEFVLHRLPKLEGTRELRSLAEAVIKDEIIRHRNIRMRRQQGIPV
jgi:hypothetical protein